MQTLVLTKKLTVGFTNVSAFTLAGNDTMNMTVTLAGQILTIQGSAPVHIDASDFSFV
jgi:hypothetical protein